MDEKPTGYITVQRALEILTCFLQSSNVQLSTQELSNMICFHKSSVSRLLRVMEYYGFLRRDKISKKYSLGKTITSLGRISAQSMTSNLLNIAKPYVDRLRDKLDEDIPFDVLSGNRIVLIYVAKCSHPLQVAFKVGDIVPPHVGAGAKAILAFADKNIRDNFIKPRATFKRFTSRTITKRSEFLEQLSIIRKEGVAYDLGEFSSDIYAVAAPVFNHDNKVVAAITIGGPSSRLSSLFKTDAIGLLKETAENISNDLFSTIL